MATVYPEYLALVTTQPLQDFRVVEIRSYEIVAFFSLRRDDWPFFSMSKTFLTY